jgi:glycosyltransferase involved in cell wall biosynthesis
MSLPFVSCVCPTYERRKFLPNLLDMFQRQSYPTDRRELILLDDSIQSNQDLIDQFKSKYPKCNITYVYQSEKLKLGKKRNMLNQMAKGDYIMFMDDDDYYCEDKIKYTITRMLGSRGGFSGSSEMYLYFTHLKQIYRFNKIGDNHCTAGTFCFTRDYLKDHKFDDNADKAEEKQFLDEYKTPLVQLDPFKTILCIAHDANTFDKKNILNRLIKTNLKLKNFIKEKHLLSFYQNL